MSKIAEPAPPAKLAKRVRRATGHGRSAACWAVKAAVGRAADALKRVDKSTVGFDWAPVPQSVARAIHAGTVEDTALAMALAAKARRNFTNH